MQRILADVADPEMKSGYFLDCFLPVLASFDFSADALLEFL